MEQRGAFRKLQLTGGSTVIVSLPKEWIKANTLGKGDLVNIEELASGDLRLSPLQDNLTKLEIELDCCAVGDGLVDLMIGGYIAGADVIKLTCSSPITRKTRADVRAFLRDTRGMEIELDDEKEIRIVSILNPSELRLQVSINRMYILISSLVNDAFDVLSGESVELLSDIDDRERQIDARRLLLERQVAASLQQPSVSENLASTGSRPWNTPTLLESWSEWAITQRASRTWSGKTQPLSKSKPRICLCLPYHCGQTTSRQSFTICTRAMSNSFIRPNWHWLNLATM